MRSLVHWGLDKIGTARRILLDVYKMGKTDKRSD